MLMEKLIFIKMLRLSRTDYILIVHPRVLKILGYYHNEDTLNIYEKSGSRAFTGQSKFFKNYD